MSELRLRDPGTADPAQNAEPSCIVVGEGPGSAPSPQTAGYGRDWGPMRGAIVAAPSAVRRFLECFVTRDNALSIGLLVGALTSIADYLTTAAASFTLCYLLPIGLVVWFRGKRAAYLIVAEVMVLSVLIRVVLDRSPPRVHFLVWNLFVECILYLVFVGILDLLRGHVERETELRRQAIDQLRHADRLTTVGKLAAGIAHELGTPMNVISGRASLLASGRHSGEEARRSGAIIVEQVERMIVIIRHLLDFARRGGTRKQASDLTELARGVAGLLGPAARASDVEIVVDGSELPVELNAGEIQQVLSNLVTNSLHAMRQGGQVLISTRVETTRAPKRSKEQAFAVLTVRDEGTGIAEDLLPRIFDPFFTTKDVGEGTGLGLSISYGIVTDHDGFMQVQSRYGRGTSVSVYLPLGA